MDPDKNLADLINFSWGPRPLSYKGPLTYVQLKQMSGPTPAVVHSPRLSADCNPVSIFAVDVSQLQSPYWICHGGVL